MSHMIWCFVKGFGGLTLVIAAFIVFIWLLSELEDYIERKTSWDSDSILSALVGSVLFILAGTLISLAICGVFK